jgi:mycothiol synthase
MAAQYELPAGYSQRAPTADDLEAVAALVATCEAADAGRVETSVSALRAQWRGLDLAEEAVTISHATGQVVAFADLLNRGYASVYVYGHVHPGHRGRGLGAFLVAWGEQWTCDRMERAPAGARVAVRHYIRASNAAARDLLEEQDYPSVRGVYVMAMELDAPPAAPEWADRIAVRPFAPGRDERAAFEAYEEASRDMWDRAPGTYESWLAFTARTDPSLLFLAESTEDGEVVGVCACSMADETGEVVGLRVRAAWRRRGLGLALLRHSFGEFHRRGARTARLSVDAESPTGAPRLYERAGMRVTESYVVHQKELRPAT